jgi:two-component system copper resistance phosphate regulon response regulator CusR
MRILLVEDDREIASALTAGLREHGMRLDACDSYATGKAQALAATYDVLILDVMLPGGSGFELCRTLRAAGVVVPILMLTARDAVRDRVEGLEAGADDYLTKPFAFAELLARVRALGRRPRAIAPETVRVADLEVQLGSRRVTRAGKSIELTAKEFALLECFIRNQDCVVDRATITSYVWDENHDPFTNVLEVLVKRLRRKIDDGFTPQLIHTVRGAGYRFGP